MNFRLRVESLELRDNPSGPQLLDPIDPIVVRPGQTGTGLTSDSAVLERDEFILMIVNPLGYIW